MPLKMNCKIELISYQALEKGSHPWFPMLYIERNTPTEGTRYWKVCLNRGFHLLLKRDWRGGGGWELFSPSPSSSYTRRVWFNPLHRSSPPLIFAPLLPHSPS